MDDFLLIDFSGPAANDLRVDYVYSSTIAIYMYVDVHFFCGLCHLYFDVWIGFASRRFVE